jgi:hypothetical protein
MDAVDGIPGAAAVARAALLASLVFASAFDSAAGLATWWLAQTANKQTGSDQAAIQPGDRGPLVHEDATLGRCGESGHDTEIVSAVGYPERNVGSALVELQPHLDAIGRWTEVAESEGPPPEGPAGGDVSAGDRGAAHGCAVGVDPQPDQSAVW